MIGYWEGGEGEMWEGLYFNDWPPALETFSAGLCRMLTAYKTKAEARKFTQDQSSLLHLFELEGYLY